MLAAGAFALEWMQRALWTGGLGTGHAVALAALGFAALGVWFGAAVFNRRAREPGFVFNAAGARALGLTRRELDVLELMGAGLSNKDIARRLTVSPNTVKTHLASVFLKLEASNRTAAAARARELSLIP
jgi:DNA-binding NarL/FixJ family response regulator